METKTYFVLVALIILAVCSPAIQKKTRPRSSRSHESGGKGTVIRICGDRIADLWMRVCLDNPRRKRSSFDVSQTRSQASSFLPSGRAGGRAGGVFNIQEECCSEGCSLEEIGEYC